MALIVSSKNNKLLAFSLVELMVVVGIISVMGAIGMAQFHKFSSKARTSEAKLTLAGIFTAEQSFKSEWSQYTTNLRNIGFASQGQKLRYIAGFDYIQLCTGFNYSVGAPMEGLAPAANCFHTLTTQAEVNTNGATWLPDLAAWVHMLPSKGSACDQNGFTAFAYGCPGRSCGGFPFTLIYGDTWTIDETKKISNTQIYLD